MAEPASTATSAAYVFIGAIGAVAGPVYGPVAMVMFAAIIGGLLGLSEVKTESKMESVRFVVVSVGISIALTGAGVWIVEQFTPLPGSLALMPVAAIFAAGRSKIVDFIGKILDVAVRIFAKRGGAE